LYLRPCCTACPAKSGKSESDFTLGDFWGIKKIDHRLFDNHGVSQVVTYGGTDMSLIDTDAVSLRNIRGRRALKHNPVFFKSAKPNPLAEKFWQRFPSEGIDCIVPLASGQNPSLLKKIVRRATDVKDYLLGNLESRLRD
ncbi:MAG: hypothetical protein K2H03_03200, partial [Muribaculaceae bacterium]|nr:hypothetical protein [Muribaculaceae bacterium]